MKSDDLYEQIERSQTPNPNGRPRIGSRETWRVFHRGEEILLPTELH